MQTPNISVVIPLYNKAAYVERAIESALCQRTPCSEVVVVDDGSTDAGAEVVRGFQDARVRLVSQANGGVSAARNRGAREARGDYVAFLDADDEYLPDFLAAIVELIKQFPAAGLYSTGYCRVLADGSREAVRNGNIAGPEDGFVVSDPFTAWCAGPFFSSSSVCVPKHIILNAGLAFPEGEPLGEDQDVWFRIGERCPVTHFPKPLAAYHLGVAGSACSGGPPSALLPCYMRLAERLERGQVPKRLAAGARKLLASHYLNICRARLQNGHWRQAFKLLLNRRAYGNPLYWLRTAGAFVTAQLGIVRSER